MDKPGVAQLQGNFQQDFIAFGVCGLRSFKTYDEHSFIRPSIPAYPKKRRGRPAQLRAVDMQQAALRTGARGGCGLFFLGVAFAKARAALARGGKELPQIIAKVNGCVGDRKSTRLNSSHSSTSY